MTGMAKRTVLLRLEIDPSNLQAGIEASKKALQDLGGSASVVSTSATKATAGFQKLGSQLTRLPRTSIFPMLNMELVSLVSSMSGATGASVGLQRGMMVLQGGAGALLGPIGILVGTLAGLVLALGISRLATEKHSKAFEDFKKQLKETTEEAKRLKEEAERVSKGSVSWAEAIKTGIIASIFGWKKANEELDKALIKQSEIYGDFALLQAHLLALSQSEYLMTIGQTIPALKSKMTVSQSMIDILKEEHKDWQINKKVLDEITNRTKDLTDAKKELNRELAWQILQQKILAVKITSTLGEPRRPELKLVGDQQKKQNEFVLQMEKNRIEAAQRGKDAIINFSWQIGDAFADMMTGTEVKWGEMLKNMVKQMIASGIMNLIRSFLSGIPGAGGVLSFLGFQHGTPYVPKTGAYILHKGEAVVPAYRNLSNVRNYNSGGNVTNYNVLYLDPEKLTRRSIVPIIEKMIQNRQTRLVMG